MVLGILLFIVCVCGGTSVAQAQATPEEHRAEVRIVDDTVEFGRTLRALAREVEVVVELAPTEDLDLQDVLSAPAPEESGLIARAWVHLATPEALVVLSDAEGERILLRRVHTGDSVDSVEVERLMQIVLGGLEALRLGGEIGVRREELRAELAPAGLPPDDPAPAQPSSRESRRDVSLDAEALSGPRFDVELIENASLWSTDHRPQHRISLRLRIGSRETWHPALDIDIGYLVPTVVERGAVGARFEGLAWRLGASLRRDFSHGALRLRAAGGVDHLHIEPRLSTDSSLQTEPPQWTALAMVEVAVGAGIHLWPHASLFLEVGLAVDLTDAVYVTTHPGGNEVVFDPFRARPFLALGFRMRVPP